MRFLLHSEKFKKNLYKWIGLYILTIMLFTGVVTYSRYISSINAIDVARTAKFKVNIEPLYEPCKNISEDTMCDLGEIRPQNTLEYDFYVDTTELEVSSDLVITIMVKDSFTNLRLYNLETNTLIKTVTDKNVLSITEEVYKTTRKITKYKLLIDYVDKDNKIFAEKIDYNDVVKIGYSAIQKD